MKHLLFLVLLVGFAPRGDCIPDFPGAGGGGAGSVGGRGGAVIEVTNLDDSGPGSLRAACETPGKRTVVFRVGGTITLQSTIEIRRPYLTIAGQTAPGGGVLLRNARSAHDAIVVYTNDVIIRFIRIRDTHDGIGVKDGAHDVIVDHCSVSWGRDENLSANGPAHDITFSWILNAECLYPHSCGILVKGAEGWDPVTSPAMVNVDVEHNLFANNWNRNPYFQNMMNAQVINNISYNWGWYGSCFRGTGDGLTLDYIGNLFKRGPSFVGVGVEAYKNTGFVGSKAEILTSCENPKVYLRGNRGPNQADPDADNWGMMERVINVWVPSGHPPGRANERSTPQLRTYPIAVHPVAELEELLLPDVGASRRLDKDGNWVRNRDSVDERVIREYQTGAGRPVKSPSEVGGHPSIASGEPYADSDRDGMPDAWEAAHGLNPGANDGAGDSDGDGYTNLEGFLNTPLPRAGRVSR